MRGIRLSSAVAAALIAAFVLPAAGAPPPPPVPAQQPNALQGFSQNRDQPVKIDSATLEVRDKDKIATFSGNVHLVQGDTTLRCKTLVVFYDQDSTPGAPKTSAVGPSGTQQIRRMEAKGGVVITQKDQTASGDSGVYDMPSNTMTLIGSVVVTQGQSVIRGERMVVDLTTGISHVQAGRGDRVQSLIIPKTEAKTDAKTDAKAESKPGDAKTTDSKTTDSKAADSKAPAPAAAPKQQRPLHPSGIY